MGWLITVIELINKLFDLAVINRRKSSKQKREKRRENIKENPNKSFSDMFGKPTNELPHDTDSKDD